MFVGLNPSTADEANDDPTIRRCVAFAQAWGYDALCMANIFAWRATDPADMMRADEPVGDRNDDTLRLLAEGAGISIAAWGVHGSYQGRHDVVRRLLPSLQVLKLTMAGFPSHPLYLPKTLVPMLWPT